jgi:hypothetical protein
MVHKHFLYKEQRLKTEVKFYALNVKCEFYWSNIDKNLKFAIKLLLSTTTHKILFSGFDDGI